MRRYLALFLPRWPIQCLRQTHPETRGQPAAVFERSQRGCILRVCSAEATTSGVHAGMSVADAKALVPPLALHELNLAECREALEELCLWAVRFSPLTGIEGSGPHAPFPQTLLLDITGCENVFGGEAKLLDLAVNTFKKRDCKVRAAIAPTLGAAWALSHYGPAAARVADDPDALKQALAPLPLASLRLSAETLADFRPLGLARIGDLLRQPRESLPSRFGSGLLERLDQALGVVPETLATLRPPPEFRAAHAFDYPVRSNELLHAILQRMIARLAGELKQAQRGARHIECWLFHEIAAPVCAEVALHRCSHSPKHLWQLLRARLEDVFRAPPSGYSKRFKRRNFLVGAKNGLVIEAEESVEAVALHVTASEPVSDQQLPLFERARDDAASGELNLLLDRLATRLGPQAVCRVQREDDPLPERAYRLVPLDQRAAPAKVLASIQAPRPLRLLPQPLSIGVDWPRAVTCAGRQHAIRSISGPERIESGWWRGQIQSRDYYIAEVELGARYWLFQDLNSLRWFLHGSFD